MGLVNQPPQRCLPNPRKVGEQSVSCPASERRCRPFPLALVHTRESIQWYRKSRESLQRYIVYNWTSVHDRVHDDRSRESPYSGTAKASLALALFSGKECKVRIIIQGSTAAADQSPLRSEQKIHGRDREDAQLPPSQRHISAPRAVRITIMA